MINLFFLINRQGKIRLTKFFESFNISERNKLLREVNQFFFENNILNKTTDSSCSYFKIIQNE